jgi:hypothetical protein
MHFHLLFEYFVSIASFMFAYTGSFLFARFFPLNPVADLGECHGKDIEAKVTTAKTLKTS